jgi:drug/metabolite transporter (DMT)-like permease
MSAVAAGERSGLSGSLTVLLLLALCWSAGPVLARIAGAAGVPPLFFLAVQAWGAVLTLGTLALLGRKAPGASRRHLALYAVSGLAGHAVPQILSFLAVQHIPVGVVGLVISMTPIVTFVLALTVRDERFSLRRAAGILVGFAGALLVLLPRSALPDPEQIGWVLLALLVPCCFAVSNVFSARLRPSDTDSRSSALGMMAASGLFLTLCGIVLGHGHKPDFSQPGAAEAALVLIAAIAGVAFFLYFAALERAGPVGMSSVSYLILLFTNAWGFLLFGEQPSLWLIAAIALIAVALVLIQPQPSAKGAVPR